MHGFFKNVFENFAQTTDSTRVSLINSIKRIMNLFYAVLLFLYCLWDNYSIEYGKIFDITGVFILLLYFLYKSLQRLTIQKSIVQDLTSNHVILLLLSIVVGIINNPIGSLSVAAGLITYTFFKNIKVKPNVISSIFLVYVACQLMELLYFIATNESLNFFPAEYFVEKRNFDGISFFRPVGLFSEANALATTFFFFGFFFYLSGLRFLLVLAAACSLISLSVYGVLVCAVLIILFLQIAQFSLALKISLFIIISFCLFYFFNTNDIFMYRLLNFDTDASTQARLGLNVFEFNFLPRGIDPASASAYGANMFAFLNYSLGILFLPYIWFLLKSFNFEIGFILFFSTLMVSYQMYTTQLFWAMLGIYFSFIEASKPAKIKIPSNV